MDDPHDREHLHRLIGRVRDALAAAQAQSGADPAVQATRVVGLLRMQASLERKLADHDAAASWIEPHEVLGSAPEVASLDGDQSLDEKRRQYQVLEAEISRTRSKLPQMRADLTIAAYHALADPSEIQRKQSEVDSLVQKIGFWIARRDSLARKISRQDG